VRSVAWKDVRHWVVRTLWIDTEDVQGATVSGYLRAGESASVESVGVYDGQDNT